ncbi:MAG: hypothetical protein LBB76_07340 [Azoarcus sp.]|jgi:hypothetical protein|nr:hypothetical protein [Azoarcus sp.]
MEKIISTEKGLDFIYRPEFNRSFFGVSVVSLGSSKRKTLKFPLGISETEINAKLNQAVAPGVKNVVPLSVNIILEHCNLYQKNIYYLYTLLHDPNMHSFINWLQEWYTRNFLASLTALAMESPAFEAGSLQEQLGRASCDGIAFTVGEVLNQIWLTTRSGRRLMLQQ